MNSAKLLKVALPFAAFFAMSVPAFADAASKPDPETDRLIHSSGAAVRASCSANTRLRVSFPKQTPERAYVALLADGKDATKLEFSRKSPAGVKWESLQDQIEDRENGGQILGLLPVAYLKDPRSLDEVHAVGDGRATSNPGFVTANCLQALTEFAATKQLLGKAAQR